MSAIGVVGRLGGMPRSQQSAQLPELFVPDHDLNADADEIQSRESRARASQQNASRMIVSGMQRTGETNCMVGLRMRGEGTYGDVVDPSCILSSEHQ